MAHETVNKRSSVHEKIPRKNASAPKTTRQLSWPGLPEMKYPATATVLIDRCCATVRVLRESSRQYRWWPSGIRTTGSITRRACSPGA